MSFRYKIMSSASRDILTSSFLTCILIYSSLIALARNSKTMLNKSGMVRNPHLIPDLRGNGFSFSPFSMMFGMGLSYITLLC
jgi:hypothetical protein